MRHQTPGHVASDVTLYNRYLPLRFNEEKRGIARIDAAGSSLQAFVLPRSLLSQMRESLWRFQEGIYFLFYDERYAEVSPYGPPVSGELPPVYIGRSEPSVNAKHCNLWKRLKSHHDDAKCGWWNVAVVFVSRDPELFCGDLIRQIESYLIREAKATGRYDVSQRNELVRKLSPFQEACRAELANVIRNILEERGYLPLCLVATAINQERSAQGAERPRLSIFPRVTLMRFKEHSVPSPSRRVRSEDSSSGWSIANKAETPLP